MGDLAGLTLSEAARRLQARETTAAEAVAECLAQLELWEPHIRALVSVLGERALADAEEMDRELAQGRHRGPLHGVPLVVKDLIDVAGAPTEAGSQVMAGTVAARDAEVVARLRNAGAIILAKANTHEFAYGALTPPTRNPWDRGRMPGGSSGGSAAAVAACEAFGALGTDTAGSVREPAALCGIVGLKPTYGRVSCDAMVPLAWTLDTVGPMARTVQDCAALFRVMATSTSRASSTKADDRSVSDQSLSDHSSSQLSTPGDVRGLRVAVAAELMPPIQPMQPEVSEVLDDVLSALSDAGASVTEVAIGDPDVALATLFVILLAESASYHRPWIDRCADLYGPDVLAYLEMASELSAVDYVDAQRLRSVQRNRIDQALNDFDVLLAPSHLVLAPRPDEDEVELRDGITAPRDLTLIRPLCPFSLTGHPALTVPLRIGETGLPVGVQLVAEPFGDERLFMLGDAVQQLVNWSPEVPSPPDENSRSVR